MVGAAALLSVFLVPVLSLILAQRTAPRSALADALAIQHAEANIE